MGTPGLGFDSWVAFAEETTYGTNPGSGWFYARLISEGLGVEESEKPYPGLALTERDIYKGHRVVGGALEPEFMFGGLGKLLKFCLGGYSFQADTPETGANTHTFTLAQDLPSFTAAVSKGDVPSGKVFLYEGGIVDSWELKQAEEDWLHLAMNLFARDETPNSAAPGTPSYPSDLPPLFSMRGTVTVAGQSLDVSEWSVAGANGLERRFLQARYTQKPVRGRRAEITGSVRGEFQDLTHYNLFLNGTGGSFSLSVESDQIVAGTTKYKLTVSGSSCKLTGETPKVGGEGPIELALQFRLLGTSPVSIELINGDGTYA